MSLCKVQLLPHLLLGVGLQLRLQLLLHPLFTPLVLLQLQQASTSGCQL